MKKELKKKRHAMYAKGWQSRLKRRAFSVIGVRCVFCHTGQNLQAAHVVPTKVNGQGRGQHHRYRDVIKHPTHYRPMCVDCHKTFDALIALRTKVEEKPIPF